MRPKLAALTMVYNESMMLPIWARHYARQVGADHCYVIDHGSTEPVLVLPGMNILRLPRSPHDDTRRARFMSKLSNSLLEYYDWIIYTDVDELVIADPQKYNFLPNFCESLKSSVVSAIGFDVQHVPFLEPSLRLDQPIGQQRGWARFTSAMCKPVLTCQPLDWTAGFHSSNHVPTFSELYLFHLHWADHEIGLYRLSKTRTMPWADDFSGHHQRIADAAWSALFNGMADLPRTGPLQFDPSSLPMSDWIRQVIAAQGQEGGSRKQDFSVNSAELWPIPEHFRTKL